MYMANGAEIRQNDWRLLLKYANSNPIEIQTLQIRFFNKSILSLHEGNLMFIDCQVVVWNAMHITQGLRGSTSHCCAFFFFNS